MQLNERLTDALAKLLGASSLRPLRADDFAEICGAVNVGKMYYDMDLGDGERYRDPATKGYVFGGSEEDGKIILFDSGEKTDRRKVYPYFFGDIEYVHAYIELREGAEVTEADEQIYHFLADIVYMLVSRDNMRSMLDFAEATDAMTGIPNIIYTTRRFAELTRGGSGDQYAVIYFNLQNFKYINETAGSKCGDEAIIQYSRRIVTLVEPDECICRMGGDNYAAFIKKPNLEKFIGSIHSITLSKLENAPGRTFEISAWIGVSEGFPGDRRPLNPRVGEASMACNIGKNRLKQSVVFFTEELKMMMNRGREIMAMFIPAIKNREFHPFFQPKVNMETGELVGFEALCRWIHEGRFIFPDQFIPVLDKEGLIHDLDMAIFKETCIAIKTWKEMGLKPPRISSNFSRKNLFIPNIEKMIYDTIIETGIDVQDVEIEITESVQEAETTRLIEFVRGLKSYGLHISIDDFGTGYSSLMLIHNIDADILKIDKSFVDEIPGDRKSEVLIESIISIAKNLNMSLIAEGVETAEQGRELLRLGCPNAQGYFYSKPVDFETATDYIRSPAFAGLRA